MLKINHARITLLMRILRISKRNTMVFTQRTSVISVRVKNYRAIFVRKVFTLHFLTDILFKKAILFVLKYEASNYMRLSNFIFVFSEKV